MQTAMSFPASPWTEALPRQEDISPEDFLPLLEQSAAPLLRLGNAALGSPPEEWPKQRIFLLARASTELETWLDDFGARESRTYFEFREITALVRWVSLAMGSLVHLDSRMASYEVPDREWAKSWLAPQVRKAALRLGAMLQACFRAYQEATVRLGLAWPEEGPGEETPEAHRPRQRLIRDRIEDPLEEGALPGNPPGIVRMAARYLATLERLKELGGRGREGLEALQQFMSMRCTEENARTHEARVHNLQSSYDSLVAGSQEERDHPELTSLRGSVSQALHLLETATALSHLYERHDVYERRGAPRRLFEQLIQEEELLDLIVNTLLKGAYEAMRAGSPIAASVVESLTRQATLDVSVPEGLQLHARPVSLIASVVNHHGTTVEAEIEGRKANAASVMQLLVLVGSHPDARAVRFRGDETVLHDLSTLFESRLGEDGLDHLPLDLDYLKV